MEPNGIDMGDYVERYRAFTLEVAVEQGMTGLKSHYRVWRDNEVALDWRLVFSDDTWPTERHAAHACARRGARCRRDGTGLRVAAPAVKKRLRAMPPIAPRRRSGLSKFTSHRVGGGCEEEERIRSSTACAPALPLRHRTLRAFPAKPPKRVPPPMRLLRRGR